MSARGYLPSKIISGARYSVTPQIVKALFCMRPWSSRYGNFFAHEKSVTGRERRCVLGSGEGKREGGGRGEGRVRERG